MSDLSVTHTFTAGGSIDASQFNTNYSDIVTYINNRNSGSTAWDTMRSTHATNVPLTANNSSGTQDIVQMKDNGTGVLSVNDGGFVNLPFQDYAFTEKLGPGEVYGAGPVKIVNWDLNTQTHSGMDSTGRFTVRSSGKYFVSASIGWAALSGANELSTFSIYVNGASVAKSVGIGIVSQARGWIVSDILSLAAGNYIEIYGASASGFVVDEGADFTRFFVMKLS